MVVSFNATKLQVVCTTVVVFSGDSGQTGRARLRFLFRFQNPNSKYRIKRNRDFFNSRIISQNLFKKFYAN